MTLLYFHISDVLEMTIRDDLNVTFRKDEHIPTWKPGLHIHSIQTHCQMLQMLVSLMDFCHTYDTNMGPLTKERVEMGYDKWVSKENEALQYPKYTFSNL